MFDISTYNLVITSLAGGLLSLLGSVGIFISLIVQRRVERLQEIMEELSDLSYETERNLTAHIYRLIKKYQAYYILPHGPSHTIMRYVDFTMLLVVISWLGPLVLSFYAPFQKLTVFYLLPLLGGLGLMIFFRSLLQNAINPLENQMLSAIIPPPAKLRSISYLSKYVNISVLTLLQQARLRIVLRKTLQENSSGEKYYVAEVVLKEELSFDDFYYYLIIPLEGSSRPFTAFGHLQLSFPKDPFTKKPVPIERNINVTLGWCPWEILPLKKLEATLVIFPLGEKHPIKYSFHLEEEKNYYAPLKECQVFIDQDITFAVEENKVKIIQGEEKLPAYEWMKDWWELYQGRKYYDGRLKEEKPQECHKEAYVN